MPKQPAGMVTGKVVNKKVFETLVSRVSTMNSKMAETRGDLGSFIKDAEETHGIHRGAFKLAVKLNNMEDLKMKDFLRGFDLYREYLKLDNRANSDLLEDGEESEGDVDHHDDDEGAANAPDDEGASSDGDGEYADEALAPGVVKVGDQVVALGEHRRKAAAAKAAADGSTTDPEEMGRRLAGGDVNPLDDLTGRRH